MTLYSAVLILVMVFVALTAPLLAPYDPYTPNMAARLQQPSVQHLLGTDQLGRDTLTRLMYGTSVSLKVGIAAVFFAAGVGSVLGLFAGFIGGWVSALIMRLIDALMTIPSIIFALTIGQALGGGINNVIIALGISLIPSYCRTMYALTLSIKENEYILAARAMGSSQLRTMFHQVLPNTFPPFIVLITMNLGAAILSEAGLSFLGLGIAPPGAAWGSMVSDGYPYLATNPLLSLAPGACIVLIVLAFNQLGDGLRDVLDPRLRGVL